ncbi:hypothetical protein [Sphingomonas sp. SORGH_AS_0879]|uniref:hypothetical protein n=1 Tax=Sphingomonas sp. SORGH_AS_0879 TaxID=3041790 RepID=UPI00278ACA2F|nr:hypothetical protein [Sphingomonas sp. SORGH_AS_0879]MDQ1232174.1 hypothetical protein [Sphingomonas sp. SORGH_AS_0879]
MSHSIAPRGPNHQSATLRAKIGRKVVLRAKVRVTSGGLLAIGGLVSSILLSTAVLVGVATRHRATPDTD